jgi:hypothetical protein
MMDFQGERPGCHPRAARQIFSQIFEIFCFYIFDKFAKDHPIEKNRGIPSSGLFFPTGKNGGRPVFHRLCNPSRQSRATRSHSIKEMT